jgi:hypothetical protein
MDEVPEVCQTSAYTRSWRGSQVDIVQLQLVQARLDCASDIIDVVVVYLCGDEEFLTRDTALFDCSTKLSFGLVYWIYVSEALGKGTNSIYTLCAVKMGVSQLHSSLHSIDRSLINLALLTVLVPSSPGPVAQHWHGSTIAELEVRNCEV